MNEQSHITKTAIIAREGTTAELKEMLRIAAEQNILIDNRKLKLICSRNKKIDWQEITNYLRLLKLSQSCFKD